MATNTLFATESIPVGKFFLVEQASVELNTSWANVNAISSPAGLVFWNLTKANYAKLRSSIAYYSKIAQRRSEYPWLFSIDYEGGGLKETPNGRMVPGVQRFVNGFTPLAHPAWLGKSLKQFGTELCELHGSIMGKELAAVGVNYPLTVVSDLAYRLFSNRGISTDPELVSQCMMSFLKGIASAESVIAVTKHFPGLGQTVGDTHDGVSKSIAKNITEFNLHLSPFANLIEYANANNYDSRLSILSSHGLFAMVDPNNLTTESPKLLTEVLVDKLNFRGIRVSDAMWMGDYGSLNEPDLFAVYVNAFLAGTDLLMIPGAKFAGAVKAFDQLARGETAPALRNSIEKRTHLSIDTVRQQFIERAKQSLERLHQTQNTLKHAVDVMASADMKPADLTRSERARYNEILAAIGYGGRQKNILP
jgi:beta-glucosidase-like glycosyl hydrolase